MSELIKVGMADLKVCKAPEGLTTLGLGSCVGICVWDVASGVGGLAHIMLPDSSKLKNNSNIYKFADTAIDELIRQLTEAGANRYRLKAKIAGGAQMFAFQSQHEAMRIGLANVEAVKEKLHTGVTANLLELVSPEIQQKLGLRVYPGGDGKEWE